MPFGLKGAPATFQANINSYLHPLLGHGVIAYLDDVFIYSADLPTHVVLLRKVLSIFLTNQLYPKFRKCQFARQELTYLRYTISADGIKPAADKIEAIRVWLPRISISFVPSPLSLLRRWLSSSASSAIGRRVISWRQRVYKSTAQTPTAAKWSMRWATKSG